MIEKMKKWEPFIEEDGDDETGEIEIWYVLSAMDQVILKKTFTDVLIYVPRTKLWEAHTFRRLDSLISPNEYQKQNFFKYVFEAEKWE